MTGRSLSIPAAGSIPEQEIAGVAGENAAELAVVSVTARRTGTLRRAAYEATKRSIDIVVSLTALIILLPFLALIALAIKLQDGGSVFYAHTRVGKGGRHFRFYKFRSMIRDADRLKSQLAALNEHADPRTFKMKRDPRITPIGRILRRASLDELPQLWNILKGDMTLVGPRPPLPCEVALYSPDDMRRLAVTPGLTCLWQVSGRGNLSFAQQVRLDVEYIERRSLLLDLEILAQTIPAVVSGRGAY